MRKNLPSEFLKILLILTLNAGKKQWILSLGKMVQQCCLSDSPSPVKDQHLEIVPLIHLLQDSAFCLSSQKYHSILLPVLLI